ncbi:hypothetical protein NMY22_g5959 [Coprinellus aureogranulatus]|nr:hypothetical protein NMY22_g5959 [Coprinellus aureogranulatus]
MTVTQASIHHDHLPNIGAHPTSITLLHQLTLTRISVNHTSRTMGASRRDIIEALATPKNLTSCPSPLDPIPDMSLEDKWAVYLAHREGYLTGAALTFVLCDMASTIDDEMKYIWRSKWTMVKVLYLVSRYLGPITLLVMTLSGYPGDPHLEKRRLRIRMMSTFACWLGFLLVNAISSMRVYALYGRRLSSMHTNPSVDVEEAHHIHQFFFYQ